MTKYCDCGRAVVIPRRFGKGFVCDADHDQSRQCHESFRDSVRTPR